MTLSYEDGSPFTTSSAGLRVSPVYPSQKGSDRIFVRVSFGGGLVTDAFVDTGSAYTVCPPDLAEEGGVGDSDYLESVSYNIRGVRVPGRLYRHAIVLVPDAGRGDAVEVEVNLFVPDVLPGSDGWDFPPVLGVIGGLDRIRFAFDLVGEIFYFGPQ